MPSLLKIGTVHFDPALDASVLPQHLANCLNDVSANDVEIRGNRVSFKGGLFRLVTSLNVLVPFGSGDLAVKSDTHEIRYCLSYQQFVVCSAVGFIFASSILIFGGFPGMSSWVFLFPVLSLILPAVNISIGISRFENLLRSCVDAAARA
jgi:hypothetical protein